MGRSNSVLGDAIRGAIGGAAGTWVMDKVTTALLSSQPSTVTARETAAQPNGRSSTENMADRIAAILGRPLSEEERSMASTALHWGLGIVPGAVYGVLRNRVPLVATGRGVVFGVVVWAINDEYLNSTLGFAGPPDAYPPETHFRGLVGHLMLGATTDTVVDILGG